MLKRQLMHCNWKYSQKYWKYSGFVLCMRADYSARNAQREYSLNNKRNYTYGAWMTQNHMRNCSLNILVHRGKQFLLLYLIGNNNNNHHHHHHEIFSIYFIFCHSNVLLLLLLQQFQTTFTFTFASILFHRFFSFCFFIHSFIWFMPFYFVQWYFFRPVAWSSSCRCVTTCCFQYFYNKNNHNQKKTNNCKKKYERSRIWILLYFLSFPILSIVHCVCQCTLSLSLTLVLFSF